MAVLAATVVLQAGFVAGGTARAQDVRPAGTPAKASPATAVTGAPVPPVGGAVAPAPQVSGPILLVELEGEVVVARAGAVTWDPGRTNQVLLPGDRVRTAEAGRAVLRWSDLSTLRLGPGSLIEIPAAAAKRDGALQLLRGLLYYFHRDKPGTMPVRTPTAYAVSLGTEFVVRVGEDGATRMELLEGRLAVTNGLGRLELASGEAAVVEAGGPPRPTPALPAVNVVQWVLHYPAVLDPAELLPALPAAEAAAWEAAVALYRAGDLGGANRQAPAPPPNESPAGRVLRAALRLSAGDVPGAEALLPAVAPTLTKSASARAVDVAAASLQTLIASVRYRPGARDPGANGGDGSDGSGTALASGSPVASWTSPGRDPTATALLAESYYQQSRARLEAARQLATRATELAPEFGLAWARRAELEFSFGERTAAERSLERALALSPRQASAQVLRGFVRAGGGRVREARLAFEEAMAVDGGLGLAWLGRGLCRIRLGDRTGGREDLQVAATLEPQRALFRSYLAKAFADGADPVRARHELDLARDLDPLDPTAWLYGGLVEREQNRVNLAIRELERAAELNQGRQVFRSGVLLDQDAAVQATDLAGVYADAGLRDWSEFQAGRAVQWDPASYAAHLFLGDVHQRRRDPGRVSQRHETAAVSEYLLAHLLSPVGAGTLARSVSAGEYSPLFEANKAGASSFSEYLSRGAWTQAAAVHGVFGASSFAVSGSYRTDPGQRPNQDSEQHEVAVQFKQQITAADGVYLHAARGAIAGGDLAARETAADVNPDFRFREEQEPMVFAGYHREWGPGDHTLALAGWVSDEQTVVNRRQGTLFIDRWPAGTNVNYVLPAQLEQRYRAEAGVFSAELQQLWQRERQGAVFGGRFQAGRLDVTNAADNLIIPLVPGPSQAVPSQRLEDDLQRATGYGYYQVETWPGVLLVAGLSYDWLRYPENFRFAPVENGQAEVEQLSPKGGIVWQPAARTTVRGAYTQSLGGVGYDQSLRLEPTQVAGFNQAFRSVIPESVAGANAGATFETVGAALEQRLGRGTFLALSGEWLRSDLERSLGVYEYTGPVTPSAVRQRLEYQERTAVLSVNQLVGDDWAFGARYRVSGAELRTHYPDLPSPTPVPVPGTVRARSQTEAWLHQLELVATYHHSSGFFGVGEGLWNRQGPEWDPSSSVEDFWQWNLQGGWRGWRRRVEVRMGVLNLFDQDYRLDPMSLTADWPRERTFMASCRLEF